MDRSSGFVLTEAQIAAARALCQSKDIAMTAALSEIVAAEPGELTNALGDLFSIGVLSLNQLKGLRPEFKLVSYTDCVERGVLVASDSSGSLVLVLSDPFDAFSEDWAIRRCQTHRATPLVKLTHPENLRVCLDFFERHLHAMDGMVVDESTFASDEAAAVITLAGINEEASPVVKLVNSTIYDALKLQASDIHLECDAGCLRVQYRIDGVLVPITQVAGADLAEQVISRVKVMAELDIAERRVPQDGRFKVRVNAREVDFRVSVMPNIFGEDAVLRLLDRQSMGEVAQAIRLDGLGLDRSTIESIRKAAQKPHGMLLVTGPTGSGKTTTLYAAITEINTGRDKIITIEDPVEYRLQRVLQIPVNEKKGLTFARGLRSILRHDPDKIMVGEIRDDETAQIAVQAALTGHLVFTTVHANNVFDVLGRFLHMGVDVYSFVAALNAIVAQRLLRINCTHCRAPVTPDPEHLAQLDLGRELCDGWTFMAGTGCPHCRGTGFKGRKAIAEVLLMDDALRELITTRAPISSIKAYAESAGLESIQSSALMWVARGETTLAEVLRVAG